jgi:hypothetical protein
MDTNIVELEWMLGFIPQSQRFDVALQQAIII